ncbi:hypothetical protein FSP39_011467 [Pinctada imbricata]|uniref:TIR domain-containing protein n=1 Tax=Pinctada imbricata TaxID=66713 RepID=A0AA88YQA5_PINIB|nr:hypothetical protein FSP39_011467 [Pinctada imbricata]
MGEVLSAPPYNLNLCVPWSEKNECDNYLSAEIIEKSCKKVIVVVSAEALQSDIFHFQLQVAHAISPGAREKRIIPVRLDDSKLPAVLKFRTSCDYYKPDLRAWIWDRIYAAFTDKLYTYSKSPGKSNRKSNCKKDIMPQSFTSAQNEKKSDWHSNIAFVS